MKTRSKYQQQKLGMKVAAATTHTPPTKTTTTMWQNPTATTQNH
jgi:hypothetical protein